MSSAYSVYTSKGWLSLRAATELGLLSVYWNLNDDGHTTIKNWLTSKQDTPRNEEIIKQLKKHKNFQIFKEHYDFEERLLKLRFLHNYVHSKGFRFSNAMGLMKSNSQTFEAQAFSTWFEAYKEVVEVLSILHLVKYPLGTVKRDWDQKFGIDTPSFGGLRIFEVERLEVMLGAEVFSAIEMVAKQDEHVKDILAYIDNLPDITDEQVEEQIVKHDKFIIENQGLEQWLKNEQKMIDTSEKNGKNPSPQYLQRIDQLKVWAIENGYDKSPIERIKGQISDLPDSQEL